MISKEMENALSHMRRRFRYQSDGKMDSWHILKGPRLLRGDCDDFSATLLYEICGRSMLRWWWKVLTFQAIFWFCKTPRGVGHVCLRYHGYWADNIYPQWSPEPRFNLKFPMIAPLIAEKLLLGKFTK